MPESIEDIKDIRRLVKQLGIKVESVEDLQRVLTALQASYNPDAIRVKTIRTICTTAISTSMGAAGFVSFFALVFLSDNRISSSWLWPVGIALIIMWAMAGAVSLAAVFVGLLWLKHQPNRSTTQLDPAAADRKPVPLPGSEYITTPDNLKFPREIP